MGEKKGAQKKSSKVKIGVVILCLMVIVGAILAYFMYQNTKYQYELETVSNIEYFITSHNAQVGVIDKEGKVIIEPKYDNIQIPNPSKPIFICLYNYDSSIGEYHSKVLNEKGEELYTQYEKVLAIPINSSISKVPYEKSVLKYKKDGKYGLIDFSGKEITKPIYESIESVEYKEGTLAVRQEGKYGAINIKGIEVFKPEFDSVAADGYYNEKSGYDFEGFIVSKKTEEGYRYGYINTQGDTLLETEYNEIDRINEIQEDKNIYLIAFKNGQAGLIKNKKVIIPFKYEDMDYDRTNQLINIQKAEKQGVSNLEGKIIIPMEYDNIMFAGKYINAQKEEKTYLFDAQGNKLEDSNFVTKTPTENDDYFITVDRENNYGVANAKNTVIIDNKYSYIDYAFDQYFIVSKEGKAGVIDTQGNMLIDFKYNLIQRLGDTKVLQAIITDTNTIDILDENIKPVASMPFSYVYVGEGYIKLASENKIQYFNEKGKEISNKEVFKNNTLFAKEKDGKWGFVDKNDTVVVDFQYDMATDFNEYGYAGIKLNGRWGVMKQDGKVIKEPVYNIQDLEPDFIGEYYRVDLGYSLPYYTNEMIEE